MWLVRRRLNADDWLLGSSVHGVRCRTGAKRRPAGGFVLEDGGSGLNEGGLHGGGSEVLQIDGEGPLHGLSRWVLSMVDHGGSID